MSPRKKTSSKSKRSHHRTPKQKKVFEKARLLAHQKNRRTSHYRKNGLKTGKKFLKEGLGIFAMTPQQKSAASRKGGTIAGRIAADTGRVVEMGKVGGQKGGIAQGNINAANGHLDRIRHIRWHVLAKKTPKKFCRFCPRTKRFEQSA